MKDLTGKKFNRLTVLGIYKRNSNNRMLWDCLCICGNHIYLTQNKLQTNHTKSCGCLIKEHMSNIGKNNKTHGNSKSKLYYVWASMKARCSNKNNSSYKDYGGRGITYDPKWNKFEEFKKDMYFKYVYAKKQFGKNIQLSLERENVNGNYCFDNCIFIPMSEQYKNKQKDQLILFLLNTILFLSKKGV